MLNIELPESMVLKCFTPAPDIVGEELSTPEFDNQGKADLNGLELRRSVRKISDSATSIELAIFNNRKTPVRLNSLKLLKITAPPFAGIPFEQYTVHRLARQKNDIPGLFRPAIQNRDMLDAAFSSAEVVAGGGISWNEFDSPDAVLPTEFHSDPGLVVAVEQQTLFVGFDGQTKHLNDVVVTSTQDRSAFKAIEAVAEYDEITLHPGESRESHRLIIESDVHERALFERHIERVAVNYGTRHSTARSIYCSWYYYGEDIDAVEVRANLDSLREKPVDLDVFQIDMGWENYFGDWDTNLGDFPEGMKIIADEIKSAGYEPGIWTAPFVIDPKSQAAEKYSDIILMNQNNEPCIFKCTKGDCFILDPFAERSEEFLSDIYSKLRSWGYLYHKLDFMRAVFIHDDARFQQPDHTRAEAYRRGVELIRNAVGEDATINACGGLYEGSAGLVDIVRLGADLCGFWKPVGSSITAYTTRIKQNISRNFYEGLFSVDPDALQLRRNTEIWKNNPDNEHLSIGAFTDDEAFSIVVNQFLAGSIVCFAERLKFIDDDRRGLLHKVIPAYSNPASYFGAWDDYLPELYSSAFTGHPDLPDWNVVSICNWNNDEEKEIIFSPDSVPGLPVTENYAAFELNTQRFLGVFRGGNSVTLTVPAHGSRLVRLTPLAGYGSYLVGTDLNLSAGMELESFSNGEAVLRKEISEKQATLHLLKYEQESYDISTILTKGRSRQ